MAARKAALAELLLPHLLWDLARHDHELSYCYNLSKQARRVSLLNCAKLLGLGITMSSVLHCACELCRSFARAKFICILLCLYRCSSICCISLDQTSRGCACC